MVQAENDSVFKKLRSHPLFSSLSEQQWELVSPLIHHEQHTAGLSIFSLEERSTDFYVIESGEVHIYRESPFGEFVYFEQGQDDLLGELSLIDEGARLGDVRAAQDTTLWCVAGEELSELFLEDKKLACHFYRYFWKTLASKLNKSTRKMKRFFSDDRASSNAAPVTPAIDRPVWFAPPEGSESTHEEPELEDSPILTPTIAMSGSKKRKPLEKLGLSSDEVELLFQYGQEIVAPSGEAIFHEGDFGDTIYFVLNGKVRISKQIAGIGEEALAIVEPGSFFGEMALVADNAVRSADCYAHEGDVLLLGFREHFLNVREGMVGADHLFLQTICKMISGRVRETCTKLFSWQMMSGGF